MTLKGSVAEYLSHMQKQQNPEMIVRCLLSSTVFHSVTARTAKNVLATLSQKSQKERTELCIKCDCQTT